MCSWKNISKETEEPKVLNSRTLTQRPAVISSLHSTDESLRSWWRAWEPFLRQNSCPHRTMGVPSRLPNTGNMLALMRTPQQGWGKLSYPAISMAPKKTRLYQGLRSRLRARISPFAVDFQVIRSIMVALVENGDTGKLPHPASVRPQDDNDSSRRPHSWWPTQV